MGISIDDQPGPDNRPDLSLSSAFPVANLIMAAAVRRRQWGSSAAGHDKCHLGRKFHME
jgi:hypothetical protein